MSGGVAPPRDAILLVRAKRMQKRAKGRSPLWHPPWGGVDGLRCLYRFSQVPSAPARESLRENFVGPTRSTRAAVPLRLRRAGFPRVMPASTQPFPACPRSSAPRGPRRGITMQSAFLTQSQKLSGAVPARRAGVARGHPVRGNGSWERSAGYAPGGVTGDSTVQIAGHPTRSRWPCARVAPCTTQVPTRIACRRCRPGRTTGVFKGVPPLTRFSCLLTCIKRQSSCGAETPLASGQAQAGSVAL